MERTRRMRSSDRRAQVAQVTLGLIAERGIPGTTLDRIAAAAGVTRAALFAHFESKREIMVAALDILFDRIHAVLSSTEGATALERIREIGLEHSRLLAPQREGFVFPLFEFIASPPEEGLREELRKRQTDVVREIARIVEQGQAEGVILADVDPYQVAWLMTCRAWTEDVAMLIGATGPDEWTAARSNKLLELIIDSITARAGDRPSRGQSNLVT